MNPSFPSDSWNRSMMRRFRWLVLMALTASSRIGGAEPHPIRANRLVKVIDGIRIEYSPGQEAYLRPVAEQITAWNRELNERQAKTTAETKASLPLSAGDPGHKLNVLINAAEKNPIPPPPK